MLLSIIIPTKNEWDNIWKLLESIKKQKNYTFDYEIIISDASSTDNTLKIVKEYWCKIVKWWLPAYWRNQWVKVSKWKYLLFLDADCILLPNSFNKWFSDLNYDVWKTYMDWIEKNNFYDLLLNLIFLRSFNLFYIITKRYDNVIWLIVKKEYFDKIWWFNENNYILEDLDFTKRLYKIKWIKRKILKPQVLTSNRRYKKVGILKMLWYFLKMWFLYNILKKVPNEKNMKKVYNLELNN